jgi:hypothetical protein
MEKTASAVVMLIGSLCLPLAEAVAVPAMVMMLTRASASTSENFCHRRSYLVARTVVSSKSVFTIFMW